MRNWKDLRERERCRENNNIELVRQTENKELDWGGNLSAKRKPLKHGDNL